MSKAAEPLSLAEHLVQVRHVGDVIRLQLLILTLPVKYFINFILEAALNIRVHNQVVEHHTKGLKNKMI